VTEVTNKTAIAAIGQRRLSSLVADFDDRVGPDPDFDVGDADLEFALAGPLVPSSDSFFYVNIPSLPIYVADTAAKFLARGSKCFGTGMLMFRSGNPDMSLLNFYNAALFYTRACCAMMGVIHYDFISGPKRRQCLIDLFPALAQPHIVKALSKKVTDLSLSSRVIFVDKKWEHQGIFSTYKQISAAVTRPESLSRYLSNARKLDYSTISSPRNSIIYGRDELPFNISPLRRVSIANVFDNPFQYGKRPFSGPPATDVINFSWEAFCLCQELCALHGGENSVIASRWTDHIYDGETQDEFFDFYFCAPADVLGKLHVPV